MGAVCNPCSKGETGPIHDDQTHPLIQPMRHAESSENLQDSAEDTPIPQSPSADDLDASPSYKEQVTSAFKTALKEGNDSLIMHFIEEYPSLDLLEVEFEDGDSCLHVAVKNKAYKLVLCLLTYGVSPNTQNTVTGDTPLHEAVRAKSINTVTLLSKFDAKTSIENNDHDTALAIAANLKYDDIVELLLPETQELVASHLKAHREEDINSYSIVDDVLEEQDDFVDDGSVEEKMKSPEADIDVKDTETDIEIDPFINLKRQKTKETMNDIRTITDKKNKLPKLKAWLEKKQSVIPYQWQKRWIFVKDSYVLWSDTKKKINDTKNAEERQKFNNWINLMAVTEVKPITKGKEQTMFIITVGANSPKGKIRDYVWRCKTEKSRDDWVKGLKKHMNHMQEIVAYLNTNAVA